MLRRLMLCAIALCALIALSGCGIERLTGPQVAIDRSGALGAPNRENDPRDPPPMDPGDPLGAAADTLRADGSDVR